MKRLAAQFLPRVLAALPDKGHQVLTDNGTPFGNLPHQLYAWRHLFDRGALNTAPSMVSPALDQRPGRAPDPAPERSDGAARPLPDHD